MLGEPADAACGDVLAAHVRGDPQGKTLLAEQRVAAIARPIRPDLAGLGVMDDVFRGIAGPGHIFFAGGQRLANGVHAGHKTAFFTQHIKHCPAHAGHGAHADNHIGAVGNLDADVGNR